MVGTTGPWRRFLGMITQKGAPSLAWWTAPLDHVFGDARRRDLKPELKQFTVNTWRAPKQILRAHLPDQRAQFRLDRRSPSPSTRLPTPIAAKAGPSRYFQCSVPASKTLNRSWVAKTSELAKVDATSCQSKREKLTPSQLRKTPAPNAFQGRVLTQSLGSQLSPGKGLD